MVNKTKRQFINNLMLGLSYLMSFVGIGVLAWIMYDIIPRGIQGLNWDLLTHLPTPTGIEGGGIANALLGTAELTLLGLLMSAPIGILAGIFIYEYRDTKLATIVRLLAETLASVPSIIVGVFVYGFVVINMHTFSLFAGGVALAVIMIPIIAKTTEDIMLTVDPLVKEAAIGLGLRYWQVVIRVVMMSVLSGIMVGIVLASARAAGETAPLLFTSFYNTYWSSSLFEPIASVPVTIFNYALSPYDDWHQKAWAAVLLLMLFIILLKVCLDTITLLMRRK